MCFCKRRKLAVQQEAKVLSPEMRIQLWNKAAILPIETIEEIGKKYNKLVEVIFQPECQEVLVKGKERETVINIRGNIVDLSRLEAALRKDNENSKNVKKKMEIYLRNRDGKCCWTDTPSIKVNFWIDAKTEERALEAARKFYPGYDLVIVPIH